MLAESERNLQPTDTWNTCAGALTSLIQPDGLGQERNKQTVHNESWCVLHEDTWDAVESDFDLKPQSVDIRQQIFTLQDTGVFPSTLLKFRRESNVSLLVAEVATT